MAVVEYIAMPRVGIALVLAALVSGCVTPIVLENPTTKERVNCTVEAEQVAYAAPPGPGTGVPHTRSAPALTSFDLERQCAGSLLN
jgi:hypothetical protein